MYTPKPVLGGRGLRTSLNKLGEAASAETRMRSLPRNRSRSVQTRSSILQVLAAVRAPLILFFIGGNIHPTIPYRLKDDRRIGHASADTQRGRGNNGRRLYEVNFPDGVYRLGREDQGQAAQREQDQGGRDEEASQRGRRRPLPQRGQRKAAAERIEHWPMIS